MHAVPALQEAQHTASTLSWAKPTSLHAAGPNSKLAGQHAMSWQATDRSAREKLPGQHAPLCRVGAGPWGLTGPAQQLHHHHQMLLLLQRPAGSTQHRTK